jgi:hypothetical protein
MLASKVTRNCNTSPVPPTRPHNSASLHQMKTVQQESEAEVNKSKDVHPSAEPQYLPLQPWPSQISPPPPSTTPPLAGIKLKRIRLSEVETEADEREDVRPLKQSRGLHPSEYEPSKETLHDCVKAEVNEPLGLEGLWTHEKAEWRGERTDDGGMSESRGTPKLYHGCSMDDADTGDDSAWASFTEFLKDSQRVLCLVGAGLSAPSGLATWRGTNGLWNDIKLKELASPKKFQEDPVTVWNFYGERMLEALAAQPNAAHHALAVIADWHEGWLTISQNVDGTDTSLDNENSAVGTLISY